ncbi:peptidoglycan DD-metalloendopeptidase family protein, partial [Myxococcota bacterium]|nr:peptidoglycan DD-metalloendopeptidase family protein [Myxococcota bacterium]
MEAYKLIWLKDAHARPVQLSIPKVRVRRAAIATGVVVAVVCAMGFDYFRLRGEKNELESLRVEAVEQREQIAAFRARIQQVDAQLTKVADLERKVRIIANLPGAVGVGGEQPIEEAVEPDEEAIHTHPDDAANPSATDATYTGRGGDEEELSSAGTPGGEQGAWLPILDEKAVDLGSDAEERAASLAFLLEQLEDKQDKLASSPSIWPSKGWLTSRFGPRVSPFTGRRQMHAGLDIAAANGTPIIAPARGRASFVGSKGPLGRALVIDHGFGVKTMYGHTHEIFVKPGQTVERGQKIASVGNSGRSTGPHLHY